MRLQTTLRLAVEEVELLDAAAARLHLDRASFVRAAALSLAELVIAETRPLLLAATPATLLAAVGRRLASARRAAGGVGRKR